MICYLNNQEINLNTAKKNCLGSGVEGSVYRYQNKAIKIYHDYVIIGKREIRDNAYKSIKTTRIITPEESVTDLYGRYIGHSQELIEKRKLFSKSFIDMPRSKVISNFRLLEDDSILFSKNFVLMDDVPHNTIDNGTLYFIDTGCYRLVSLSIIKEDRQIKNNLGLEESSDITNKELERRLKIKNLDTCYVAIWENIKRNLKFSTQKLNKLKKRIVEDLDQSSEDSRLSKILDDYMRPDDTIRTLVKRM